VTPALQRAPKIKDRSAGKTAARFSKLQAIDTYIQALIKIAPLQQDALAASFCRNLVCNLPKGQRRRIKLAK
jgi:ABC-type multidrug transport system ATPase subunit